MSRSVAPPSPQEVHRKLSIHTKTKNTPSPAVPVSGTESDSDSVPQDILSNVTPLTSIGASGSLKSGTPTNAPLTSIAERRPGSGDESEEDEDEEEEGGWKTAEVRGKPRGSADETVIKAGYLWKKGERRKTWKKRWFVLRPAHLAYYKTSAEYQLLKILDLGEVHSCTAISLKKHAHTFGLVSPVRTFYLQADTQDEVQSWVKAIQDAREFLMATSTVQSAPTPPMPIPETRNRSGSQPQTPFTPSPTSHFSYMHNVTSSDSEDGTPSARRTYSTSSQNRPVISSSPSKALNTSARDPSKVVISGYLMKCGSKRHNWRKRWFVFNGEKLIYSGSHMDTKPHREFKFSQILDALEYDLPPNRQMPASPPLGGSSPMPPSSAPDAKSHTFKIVTTKRTLLLCAPSEEEEIKWLSAICALIARRKDSGVVPGESRPVSSVVTGASPAGIAEGHQGASGVAGSAISAGLKGKGRRLSASGMTFPISATDRILES
ncbi:hypothetical protein PILCRDRAFT_818497 [Piloderma croceum F 1598]|uniref:PH domain-containing protein n=1 Tax=Piloderma croceum (strain F 1598) TaxID=765440 RepID=A0A0C3G0I9_PILCF|nr:hypothetical protein PILCRDRAFT_818497 [Piloderma croceum F 1598]